VARNALVSLMLRAVGGTLREGDFFRPEGLLAGLTPVRRGGAFLDGLADGFFLPLVVEVEA